VNEYRGACNWPWPYKMQRNRSCSLGAGWWEAIPGRAGRGVGWLADFSYQLSAFSSDPALRFQLSAVGFQFSSGLTQPDPAHWRPGARRAWGCEEVGFVQSRPSRESGEGWGARQEVSGVGGVSGASGTRMRWEFRASNGGYRHGCREIMGDLRIAGPATGMNAKPRKPCDKLTDWPEFF
jgi:hypothetical protein